MPSLKYLSLYYKRPPLPFLKAAAKVREIVESLAAIHSAGVCHGGKRCSPNFNRTPSTLLNLDLTHSNVLFEITDLNSWTEDEIYRYLGPPRTARNSCVLLWSGVAFGYPPSYAVDLWALGCLIFEIHTFHLLIPTFGSSEEALAMAIETVGALPEEWQESYYDKYNPLKAAQVRNTAGLMTRFSELALWSFKFFSNC
jgi:serine/threonine-protein kinase SRPK3